MSNHDQLETMLPITGLREPFLAALTSGPVVVSSPTGSGKSTQVPRWCPDPVLVVEPRRVACRSLAQRVAELEGVQLGKEIGYRVRDERRDSSETRLLFATPGIVLREFEALARFRTIIIDELHERRLDTDLLLALLRGRAGSLVAMSATVDADRVARYLGGRHVHSEGRQYPVRIDHLPNSPDVPDARGLEERVLRAVRAARTEAGDVLVFLPGKREIESVARSLDTEPDVDVVELHGGLSLERQSRAFAPSPRRKIILATNVAETSVTVPGVGVVIDSGLVRRTRYHEGRGHLALVPIALDSADQRAGRAGRTAPGVAYRLWDARAHLAAHTPPEIHRESLVPLMLAAAACGSRVEALDFLDPPKDHALELAREQLLRFGALDARGGLTDRGQRMFGLPLDPWLARLLIEAEREDAANDGIDLVAALSVDRPLFVHRPTDGDDDLRTYGCDATALIRAVRDGDARRHGLDPATVREARASADRLRQALGRTEKGSGWPDREALIRSAVGADQRSVHVPRRRRGRTTWANGGPEIELSRDSAVRDAEKVEALIVFDTRALGAGPRGARILATSATPVKLSTLAKLGVGRERVAETVLEGGRVMARIERVFAKKVIAVREESPTGDLARSAIAELFLRGTVFPEAQRASRERLARGQLAARLGALGLVDADTSAPPSLEDWIRQRLAELGVETGDDLALLSAEDLTAPDVPYPIATVIDREFPLEVHVGDATYRAEYDVAKKQVVLVQLRGHRQTPPPASFVPRFGGFRVFAEAGGTMHRVR